MIGAIDGILAGIAVFGWWLGGFWGNVIMAGGITAIAAVTVGGMIGPTAVGLLRGAASGYLLYGESYNEIVIGFLVGGAFGFVTGSALGSWKKGVRLGIDRDMRESRAIIERNLIDIPVMVKDINTTIDNLEQYIIKYNSYKRELSFITERFKGIKYKKNDPFSLRGAATIYGELRENLDRMDLEIKLPYSASSAWEFDVQSYRSGRGRIGMVGSVDEKEVNK